MGMSSASGSGKANSKVLLLLFAVLFAAAIAAAVKNNRTIPVTPPGQFGPSVSASPTSK